MKGFAFLDYLVVIGYLCAIAAFGSSFYRRKTTAEEYFLGGRSMSWLPAGISIIAADLSAITIMGTPAWNYKHNLELVWAAFGYPLMAPLVIFVFVPFYAKLNLYTAYECLERRFSLNVRLPRPVFRTRISLLLPTARTILVQDRAINRSARLSASLLETGGYTGQGKGGHTVS